MPCTKRKVVGVLGSGSDRHERLAQPLGEGLGRLGVDLLTGAGQGTMAAVSRAFAEAPPPRGIVIGIVPGDLDPTTASYHPKPGYPNEWVELPIYTHLPWSGALGQDSRSRNHLNVLTSDLLVLLPGGPGTASEAALAERYGKPVLRLDYPSADARDGEIAGAVDAVLAEVERHLQLQRGK